MMQTGSRKTTPRSAGRERSSRPPRRPPGCTRCATAACARSTGVWDLERLGPPWCSWVATAECSRALVSWSRQLADTTRDALSHVGCDRDAAKRKPREFGPTSDSNSLDAEALIAEATQAPETRNSRETETLIAPGKTHAKVNDSFSLLGAGRSRGVSDRAFMYDERLVQRLRIQGDRSHFQCRLAISSSGEAGAVEAPPLAAHKARLDPSLNPRF
jgi:hypothetical protein